MSIIGFAYWQVVVVIQTLIFEEALGIFNNTSVKTSIVVSSPIIFYVNKNDTGKLLLYFGH